MSNPQTDHDAAGVSRFEEAIFHAVRRFKGGPTSSLIAVSGGADSTALMLSLSRVAVRAGLKLEVASLDHGVRKESAAEAAAVVERAQQLGRVAHVRALGLVDGPAFEQRARDARYAALEQLRVERGLDLIATGHTASDQAETVLMRLARGAALGGSSGIRSQRERLIRPMLGLTRTDVRSYLKALREPFVEDPMNADPRFFRVRVRSELLPTYEEIAGPRVALRLARFAQYAGEDDLLLEHEAGAALERIRDGRRLDAVALQALARPIRRRVIARWLVGHQLEVDAALIEDILEAVASGRPATLPADFLLVNRAGWLSAEPAPSRNFTEVTGTAPKDAL